MSNYLKKGRREAAKNSIKRAEAAIKTFNEILYHMNMVYYALKEDDTLTKDNLDEKISSITDFDFSEEQIKMLHDDLLTQD